jgi:plasmid stabilization system protein ParE
MPQAQKHLRQVYAHIAHDSISIAQQIVADLAERTRPLDELPLTGKVIPEAGDENLREVHAHSWRIFYQMRNRDVFVFAIVHKRRQLAPEDIRELFRQQ